MADFNELIKIIESSVKGLNKALPSIQRGVLDEVLTEIRKLDYDGKNNVKNSVKNIRVLNGIKNRLMNKILTPDYKGAVKEYLKVFNEVSAFNKDYFRETEKTFRPPAVVEEIKTQTVSGVVSKLTEAGIGANIADPITDILRQNITTGTSYAALADQLREFITKTETAGGLERYVKQIAVDSVNQYTASYMNTISGDLGYEWFKYQGKDITTTRHFCDAMTDRDYFHISEVPNLLAAKGLYYTAENGELLKVEIYSKTGLPQGMIPGTNVENFFVRRGGYNCGHQIFPVHESRVPDSVKSKVKDSGAYNAYKGKPIYDKDEQKKAVKENRDENGYDATSAHLHQKKDGSFTADRQELHNTIKKKFTSGLISQEKPLAKLVAGAPANGKSTYVESNKNKPLVDAVHVDPDAIKMEFPEYRYLLDEKDAKAAYYIHEESSLVADNIISDILSKKSNVTIDRLLTSEKSVQKVSKQLKKAGYKSEVDYTTIDTELSVKLADDRGKRTGRFVPESVVRAKNAELPSEFESILDGGYFDTLNLWDTNTKGKPILILSQKEGHVTVHNRELYKKFLSKAGLTTSRY